MRVPVLQAVFTHTKGENTTKEGQVLGEGKPNRLIHEVSPYLQQHAHNPVDWYPWGEEALNRAKAENKPIFLSIGYSACHWCHAAIEHPVAGNDNRGVSTAPYPMVPDILTTASNPKFFP